MMEVHRLIKGLITRLMGGTTDDGGTTADEVYNKMMEADGGYNKLMEDNKLMEVTNKMMDVQQADGGVQQADGGGKKADGGKQKVMEVQTGCGGYNRLIGGTTS
eukprot:gene32050-16584_t